MKSISPEEHQRRLALYQKGLSDAEIARKLGRSDSSIRHWRNKHNLPPNIPGKWQGESDGVPMGGVPMEEALPPEGCEKVRLFLRCLATYAKKIPAGQKFDIGAFMITWRELYGEGLIKHAWSGKSRWTPDKDRLARQMREKGYTGQQIAEALGVSMDTVTRRLRESSAY